MSGSAAYLNYSGGIHILQLDAEGKNVTIFQEYGDPTFDQKHDIRWKSPIITLGNTLITGEEFRKNYTLKYSHKYGKTEFLGGSTKYLTKNVSDNINLDSNMFKLPREDGYLKRKSTYNDDDDVPIIDIGETSPSDIKKNEDSNESIKNYFNELLAIEDLKDEGLILDYMTLLTDYFKKLHDISPSQKCYYLDRYREFDQKYNLLNRERNNLGASGNESTKILDAIKTLKPLIERV